MANQRWRLLTARRVSPLQAIAVGFVAALVAAALRVALRPVLHDEAAFTPNFMALFAATSVAGWLSGVTAMSVGGLLTYYFFFDPVRTLARPLPDLMSLLLFWAIAGLIVVSIAELRSALRRLAMREKELLLSREQEQTLAREMGHRVKNLLAVVQSIVDHSLKGATDLAEGRRRVQQRLSSLATAQALALDPMKDVNLEHVLSAGVQAIADERIALEVHCAAEIAPDQARGLVLALHELATNALKYGALSRPEGRVELVARCARDRVLEIKWCESGGPPVSPPTREGFGTRLITRALDKADGEVEMQFPPEGARCVFRLWTAAAAG